MTHKPSLCDLCGKEADLELEECWQVVCIAPHEEDYYHEKCIQKFMRAMPGKNYDPSRRSGLPCPRGVGKGTQYPVKCPCKVAHCQKVILKANQRSSASSGQATTPAQAPVHRPPAPRPKAPAPKPAKPAACSKLAKAPEHTWVPQKTVAQEPARPKIDPLGRNAAAAAAAAASKAAKKNAKRAAAKQLRREETTTAGESVNDTSSMAESGAVASVWSAHAGGTTAGSDSNAGDAGEEDWDDGGYDLDADQLLLLELLKQQRNKQPQELLSFVHADTTHAYSSSEEEELEEEQQRGAVSAPGAGQPVEAQQQFPVVPPGFQQQQQQPVVQQQQQQHAPWLPQHHLPHQQLPLQASSVSATAGLVVPGLQQQLAASSISAPHFPARHQHLAPPVHPPQQPYPIQQQSPASSHSGMPGHSYAGGGYEGSGYTGAGLVSQPAEHVPPSSAGDGEQEDYSTDELLALLMGG